MNKFINLYNTTEYSFLNSLIRIEDLVKQSKENDLKAVALTDYNNMFGLGIFLDLCSKYKIKPIIGVDIDIAQYRFILLAKNYAGFQKINNLILNKSKNIELSIENIIDNDIFVIDHPTDGYYAKTKQNYIINNGNYFVNSIDISIENGIYVRQNQLLNIEDNEALNILQKVANLPTTIQYDNYFDSPDIDPIIIDRINKIIDECNFELPPKTLNLARFENNDDETNEKLFAKLINEGLQRIAHELPKDKDVWYSRLTSEVNTIRKLGFVNYFLIIQDLVNWAKNNNIAIGPGRGSAGGSFVSYLLNITSINPLKYDLLFERFLNPERVSWPDIDIDIQDDRRQEVFDYLKDKYGADNVALISTFQTIGAKTAIRDVGRVLGISLADINRISKTLDGWDSLAQASIKNHSFIIEIEKYPQLLEYSLKIEGLPRQQSFHPAGLIIAKQKISNYAPTSMNATDYQQVQLTMDYVEDFGLLKIDLLGLKTLTEVKNIENNLPLNEHFDYLINNSKIDILNDTKTLDQLNKGFTEGIFQLESAGMKKTISTVQLNTFDDLYAIISLFRPGPMAYIKDYAKNKDNFNFVTKIHPIYDEILKSTYGIMVYQEQIMLIAQKVAGMSFSQADFLRRAISKKDESKIKQYKQMFVAGALNNGLKISQINSIYSNIERFAEYGFNKSHAVAYAYLTMKMAYYKTKYPLYFYSALISSNRNSQTKISSIVDEIKNKGIKVNSPDIHYSQMSATIVDNEIYLPFDVIKGFGTEGVNKILNERKNNGEFSTNLNEIILRLRFAGITESMIETLTKANVFRKYGNVKFIENSLTAIFECYKLFAKKTWLDSKQTIIDLGYLDLNHDLVEQDIDYEAKNEINLLGQIYNAFNTAKYKNDSGFKLLTLPVGSTEFIVTNVKAIRKLNQKPFFVIELNDDTKTQAFFINNFAWNLWSPLKSGDVIKAQIKNDKGKLKLLSYKEI
ncbi:DNA polymerase III, alpha subunit [Mycoplasmopsis bovigenitalium 51080]|uniref:DNA-directed DNA polymerase n=1 Tax=Mycoplasmopsis bovigenitalium 51080 TaxID=1188235 RepID=N9V2Z9_9BACT|nr:DNA polymerase III subunit alpha [Mycoplasmopsis bovigenitalium]ENY69707.1 DNA polymerase III, alpha subunit [Mycoplasmopsis bovigenitalium 51080]